MSEAPEKDDEGFYPSIDISTFLHDRRVASETSVLNTSGITPTEYKVLIRPKEVAEKVGSVFLPEQSKEAEKWATIEGVLIAKSPLAFTYANADEWAAAHSAPPEIGKRVLFAKYSGVRHKGRDGVEYVIANDKDVLAVLDD
jgi:co-chaperonin GroES (HSP10)